MDEEDGTTYVEARVQAQIVKRISITEVWEKTERDLQEDLARTRKLMYLKANKNGSSTSTYSVREKSVTVTRLLTEREDIAHRLEEYIVNLLSVEAGDHDQDSNISEVEEELHLVFEGNENDIIFMEVKKKKNREQNEKW